MKPYLLRRSADDPALAVLFRNAEDEALFRRARGPSLDGDLLCCGGLMYDLEELLELHRKGGFPEIFAEARDIVIHAPGLALPVEWIRIGTGADSGVGETDPPPPL